MTNGDLPAAVTGAYAAFEAAAQLHEIVPIAVELHADSLTPVGAFERFVGTATGFLLESVEDGLRFGRFSFLGRRPLGTLIRWPDGSSTGRSFATNEDADALSVVQAHLASVRVAELIGVANSPVPLRSGVVGLFGWDTVRSIRRCRRGARRRVFNPIRR